MAQKTKAIWSKPDGSGSVRSIGYAVKLLSQLNHRVLQNMLQPYDLTPFHWLVLRCLWHEDGLPISDITTRLQEVGGTMTGVLDRMQRRGLITRTRDPLDGRVSRVYLTKKGRDLEDELMPLVESVRAQMLNGISAQELAACEAAIEKMMRNCQSILSRAFIN